MLDMMTLGWPELNPASISMDYETALMNSFGAYFPLAETHGCFFHLVQNMKRKVAACGLSRRYREEPDFALKAKMISAMAFVPIHRIEEALGVLQSTLPAELQPVLDYFEDHYVGRLYMANGTPGRRQPQFPVAMWTVYERTMNDEARTNNYVEAFHRSLQRQFGVDHPGLFKFIDGLKTMQHMKDAQMERYISGHHPPKKRNQYVLNDTRIKEILNRMPDRPISQTLRGIAHTYDMNP